MIPSSGGFAGATSETSLDLFIRKTKYFLLFSERNIDSNEFDKAGYKADILSTYFHDDRLNASEVGQSSICERIGCERPLN